MSHHGDARSAFVRGSPRYRGRYPLRPRAGSGQRNYTGANPRIISGNGPQFIAKDFKELIRILGMTHVGTSPFYPQSNGKSKVGTIRSRGMHSDGNAAVSGRGTVSGEGLRRALQQRRPEQGNRLHHAEEYAGWGPQEIHTERDRELEAARRYRQIRRQSAARKSQDASLRAVPRNG
jgi:putative transposase